MPTYYHQTKQHNVACDVISLGRQLAWAAGECTNRVAGNERYGVYLELATTQFLTDLQSLLYHTLQVTL